LNRFVWAFVAALFVSNIFSATPAFAQGAIADKPPAGGPRRQLGTIIYAGLGGAVLGLSTLSFYGRPQDKLANIAIGFAVGVIAGTAAVTYNAATNPDDFYGVNDVPTVIFEDHRDGLLGPGATNMVARNKTPDATAPVFSASYEVYTF
jgi:hypothetical protein